MTAIIENSIFRPYTIDSVQLYLLLVDPARLRRLEAEVDGTEEFDRKSGEGGLFIRFIISALTRSM